MSWIVFWDNYQKYFRWFKLLITNWVTDLKVCDDIVFTILIHDLVTHTKQISPFVFIVDCWFCSNSNKCTCKKIRTIKNSQLTSYNTDWDLRLKHVENIAIQFNGKLWVFFGQIFCHELNCRNNILHQQTV